MIVRSNRRSAHSTRGSKCGIYNKGKVHFSYFSSAAVVVVVARSHHQLVVQFPFLQKHYQQS